MNGCNCQIKDILKNTDKLLGLLNYTYMFYLLIMVYIF